MKKIEYKLPKMINEERPEGLVVLQDQLESQIQSESKQVLILNWSEVKNVELSGWAILCMMLDFLHEHRIPYKSLFMHKNFSTHPIGKLFIENKSPTSLIPISQLFVQQKNQLLLGQENSISMQFIEQFKLMVDPSQFDEDLEFDCNIILTELMQNALDHSGSERYVTYIELNTDTVQLGVLDRGVSVPARLAMKYHFPDDLEAIEQSLKNGITTRRTRIGGKGLYYTFMGLKERAGSLTYLSARGQLKRHFNHRTIRRKKLKAQLRGTWFFCQLKR